VNGHRVNQREWVNDGSHSLQRTARSSQPRSGAGDDFAD